MANKAVKKELVTIKKSGNISVSLQLDPGQKLTQIRKELQTTENNHGDMIMNPEDDFLLDGSSVLRSQESQLTLEDLLKGGHEISIGSSNEEDPLATDDGVQHFNQLGEAEKESLFNNVQLFRGFTFDKEGFKATFKKAYSWKKHAIPDALRPRIITEVSTESAYSKLTHSMQVSNVQSGSASLSTPYGGGDAEFKYAQSREKSSEKVTQYLTGKFIVRKIELEQDSSNFVINPDFEDAVVHAVDLANHSETDLDKYMRLLGVLNEYGYYIPEKFTLGGVLFSSDKTSISSYSESKTTETEFGGSFKAAFKGIGGGASYKNAHKETETTTSTNKFQVTSLLQIGGKAGTTNDFSNWAKSLDKAIYWDICSIDKLYPTIGLIEHVEVQNKCIKLMNKYNSYPAPHALQPNLNMVGYATEVENVLIGDDTPWG